MSQYLGDISAYALAVSQGYTGTEEEYAELMASYATVGQTAVTAAQTATTKASEAATSATTATTKASEAATSATTATTAAEAAQADADAAALDASQALSAASTATTKATEATTAAATATSAKTDAVAANTAAQSAKTAAQTAQTGAETAAASVQSSAAQIQTNADDISELKEDFASLDGRYYTDYGINRNPGNDSAGYLLSDGTLKQTLDWVTTDYCYVGDLDAIVGSALHIGGTRRDYMALFFLCTYNANKEFIGQVSGQSTSRWTVTDGVSYVRFSYHADSYTDVMLEGGDAISYSFIPYNPQVLLKGNYYRSGINWKGKKWVCVGDSLTEGNIRTTRHYHDYIRQETGISVINMGSSGTGYARGAEDNKAFYQRISSCPTDADVVTIFGSFNDLNANLPIGTVNDTGTDTLAGCINTTITNLQMVIPLVNLGIVAPTPWAGTQPSTNGNAYNYVEMLKAICERRSIPFLDLWRCSNLRPWDADFRELAYSKDEGNGTHPDENGHKLIAPRFKVFLESLLV